MSKYFTFLGKEFTENIRTKRVLVLTCVYLFFAITAPLLTRYMAEFLGLFIPAGDESMEVMIAVMGNPQWFESYAQFYSNLSQLGIFAVMFMYMNTIRKEISSGTASLMFSKGLGHAQFVMAKFSMAAVLLFIITLAATLVAYVYTFLLFEEAGAFGDVLLGNLVFAAASLMILGVVMFFSSIAKSSGSAAGMIVGVYFAMVFAQFLPTVGRFIPINLFMSPIAISMGDMPPDLLANLLIACGVLVVALFGAIKMLKRAEV